eukprot:gene42493-51912_t
MAVSQPMLPLIYHPGYTIHFYGFEKLMTRFDTHKYSKIFSALAQRYDFTLDDVYQPPPLNTELLREVHTKDYLASLSSSSTVARIAEAPPLAWMPNFLLQRRILDPMRLATSGTVLAVEIALRSGWAINLSGGYHHAKADRGEGFSFFADIPLAIHEQLSNGSIEKVLIVDLDAHQ